MIKLHPAAERHLLHGMSIELDLLVNDARTNGWHRISNTIALPARVT